MCCGQKRSTLNSQGETRPSVQQDERRRASDNRANSAFARVSPPQNSQKGAQSASASQASLTAVQLRYLERSPILVRGPVSTKTYRFTGAYPLQNVDSRDVDALLRTGFFRRN